MSKEAKVSWLLLFSIFVLVWQSWDNSIAGVLFGMFCFCFTLYYAAPKTRRPNKRKNGQNNV